MGLAERSWNDSRENYADSVTVSAAGSVAVNAIATGQDYKQPVVLYSLTVSLNQAGATGDVALLNGSATADTNERKLRLRFASAANGQAHCEFPRGVVFDNGLIVSGTTVTGDISLSLKQRFS